MIWLLWLSVAVGLMASAEDLWRREISNVVTASAFVVGVVLNGYLDGWDGVVSSLLGGVIGFAVFLLFFVVGGMGGGDVKLMAAFGAIIGKEQVITAAVMTALVGGVMALAFLGYRKIRRLVTKPGPELGEQPDRKLFIPYAPAISLGVLLSFLSEEKLWTNV
ncbi:MAG: prepilin peptidase [Bryobacterales bacterium]|nr:prepilin peptidase [Acidobacteriota bacterium]MCB9384456.1 prepilin peptidase [Bryobacterales bacterium]